MQKNNIIFLFCIIVTQILFATLQEEQQELHKLLLQEHLPDPNLTHLICQYLRPFVPWTKSSWPTICANSGGLLKVDDV